MMLTRSAFIFDGVPPQTQVESLFRSFGATRNERAAALSFLEPLRVGNSDAQVHYEHSLRVALLAEAIGQFMHLDSKPLFYAGLLHDTGKCRIPPHILGKREGWSADDAAIVSRHVMEGYDMIKGRFKFVAEIILLHHRFQDGGYPSELPPFMREYSEGSKLTIRLCGYLLALADTYDALHRTDRTNGNGRGRSGPEIKAKMLESFPDHSVLVKDLYGEGIFVS